jgi:hypothetical protein
MGNRDGSSALSWRMGLHKKAPARLNAEASSSYELCWAAMAGSASSMTEVVPDIHRYPSAHYIQGVHSCTEVGSDVVALQRQTSIGVSQNQSVMSVTAAFGLRLAVAGLWVSVTAAFGLRLAVAGLRIAGLRMASLCHGHSPFSVVDHDITH